MEKARCWVAALTVGVVVSGWVVPAGAVQGPLEVRGHTSLQPVLEVPHVVERGWTPAPGHQPKGSALVRSWYGELPPDGRWRPDGSVRTESVVLLDPGVEGLRFAWSDERDFTSQRQSLVLRVWRAGDLVHTVRMTLAAAGSTTSPQVTLELAGQRWVAMAEEWRSGTFSQGERMRLRRALAPDLRGALELFTALAAGVSELHQACELMTHPLLGRFDRECPVSPSSISLFRGRPDCAFDATFGESCPSGVQGGGAGGKAPNNPRGQRRRPPVG